MVNIVRRLLDRQTRGPPPSAAHQHLADFTWEPQTDIEVTYGPFLYSGVLHSETKRTRQGGEGRNQMA